MTERPEFQGDDPWAEEHRPAGPVPGSGSPSSQAAGGDPDSAPPAGEAAAADVEKDLGALLADAEAKRDEYLELARRAQADFENYRKRMAAEVQAAALRGKAEVTKNLVEAVDVLERAFETTGVDVDRDDPLEG